MTSEIPKEFKPSFKEFKISPAPTPDIVITEQESGGTDLKTLSIPSVIPKSEKDDYFLQVRATTISEIRTSAIEVNNKKINYAELMLAVGMLCAGNIFNKYDWVYTSTILGIVTGACIVGYYFISQSNVNRDCKFASKVLKMLPNEKENKPNGY